MGIAAPSSQGTFFKVGGAFFLILSLIVGANIFHQLGSTRTSPSAQQSSQATQQQVLGAYSQNTAEVQTTIYTVQKNDTLFDIAQSHGVSWQVIAALNNLAQPYTVKPGTQLKIPNAQ